MGKSDGGVVWYADEFKKALMPILESNMEIVGEFTESDARKRLLSIGEPAWGRAYRTEIVARLLDNQTEIGKNEVVTKMGVRKSRSGSHHGFFIEIGSRTSPPHPFLRPAVFGNAKKIVALVQGK